MAVSTAFARFRTAAWLGWLVDSNWADPFVFVVYAVARPLGTALILAGIYWAARGPAVRAAAFTGFWIANALHTYVTTVLVDMGWIVFGDREEYETLKLVVASPMGMMPYLAGRSMVKYARATLSAALMLLLGWYVLGIRWSWAAARPGPLLVSFALGLAASLAFGYLVAGLSMVLTRAGVTVLEGITLGLYLLCGVIFPLDYLPGALQWLAFALPFTWWYEAVRRFLLGHGSSARLAHLGDGALLGTFAAVTLVTSLAALQGYRALERHARRTGCIDQTTMF